MGKKGDAILTGSYHIETQNEAMFVPLLFEGHKGLESLLDTVKKASLVFKSPNGFQIEKYRGILAIVQ